MNNLPKINQLKNLRTVIYAGSIRAAALASYQTQSAVSRSIQELEGIVGAQLLKRGVGGVQLTDIGEIFEPYMNRVLNELERGLNDVSQFIDAPKGSIKVGCSHLPVFVFMPKIIKKFQEKYASVKLTVIEGQLSELAQSVRTGEMSLFVGITTPDISIDEFHVEFLSDTQFYVFCSKHHLMVSANSLSELRNEKWYLPGSGVDIFNSLEKTIFPYGKGPQCSILHGDSIAIVEQLILKENYISVGPKEVLECDYLKGKVDIISVKETLPAGRYAVLLRKQIRQPPLIKFLSDEIRNYFESS
ncbi:TPA: LysR family transcriptional regulator [Yersinia enterocolitica]|uniref:LysR substrate-binding domain-containing protein n=1 Tax=Yersinia enterocolitica TaxID=630 RepID=UPI001C8D9F17|nr:LysR substrate-binding domain-containing protein [Yersinia enterocolitica]MBX9488593.1 LysR family transcriptional regulator [Yersinia enterocolitica]MBX9492342.1 LysR family transcriptional regulator [Yersinia enterocolitica]HEN3636217.1 LysR family transcriptional regulator [Yersinia enterocolitica]